jgi:hypothetical protein
MPASKVMGRTKLLTHSAAGQQMPLVPTLAVLQSLLAEAVEEFISAGTAPAEQQIQNLVACELAYINTSHPQFIGGNRAIQEVSSFTIQLAEGIVNVCEPSTLQAGMQRAHLCAPLLRLCKLLP